MNSNPLIAYPHEKIYSRVSLCLARKMSCAAKLCNFEVVGQILNLSLVGIIFCLHNPTGPWPPHRWFFEITLRHTTVGRIPLDEWSARRRDLYLTTHNTHMGQTGRHTCPSGNRIRNSREQAAADQCLRPRGHKDRRLHSTALTVSS